MKRLTFVKQKELLLLGLETYVTWLNQCWKESMSEEGTYTVEQFTIDNPKKDLFGFFRILSCTLRSSNSDAVLHATVHDGDDGGASDLIIGFHNVDWSKRIPKYEVEWIMQGFDGSWHMIFNEGKFIHV